MEMMDCAVAAPCSVAAAPQKRMSLSNARSAVTQKLGAATRVMRRAAPAAAPVYDAMPAPTMAGAAIPPPSSSQAPPAQQQQQQQPQRPQDQSTLPQAGDKVDSERMESACRDYTQVPKEMDESFERLDVDSQLRPTIITPGDGWTKRAQKALLAEPTQESLDSEEQKKEKDAAFDLLDALTKSGALPITNASLHIVVAATHCFDKTITETVVQDNVNPIDKVERSTLIMASTVHQQPISALIRDAQLPRVQAASPMLFIDYLH